MNKRLTDEELAEIKERAEKATEGPWGVGKPSPNGLNNVGTMSGLLTAQTLEEEDASFIAHAREDIPKLLAEVEYRREKQAELLEYNRQYFAEIKRLRAEIARLEMEAITNGSEEN